MTGISINTTEAAVLEVWRAWHAASEQAEDSAEGYGKFISQGHDRFGAWVEDEVNRLMALASAADRVTYNSDLW